MPDPPCSLHRGHSGTQWGLPQGSGVKRDMRMITQSPGVGLIHESCLLEDTQAGSPSCRHRTFQNLLVPPRRPAHWSCAEEKQPQRTGLVRMCRGEQAGHRALFVSTPPTSHWLSHFLSGCCRYSPTGLGAKQLQGVGFTLCTQRTLSRSRWFTCTPRQ